MDSQKIIKLALPLGILLLVGVVLFIFLRPIFIRLTTNKTIGEIQDNNEIPGTFSKDVKKLAEESFNFIENASWTNVFYTDTEAERLLLKLDGLNIEQLVLLNNYYNSNYANKTKTTFRKSIENLSFISVPVELKNKILSKLATRNILN